MKSSRQNSSNLHSVLLFLPTSKTSVVARTANIEMSDNVEPQINADERSPLQTNPEADAEDEAEVRRQLEQAIDCASDVIVRQQQQQLQHRGAAAASDDKVAVRVDVAGRSAVVRVATPSDATTADVDGLPRRHQQPAPTAGYLTKNELLANYADSSMWIRIRWCLLALIGLGWLAMLGTAVVIIVVTPKCAARQQLEWWQSAVVYEVDTRSFQDTDGDGMGDLRGTELCRDVIGLHGIALHRWNIVA